MAKTEEQRLKYNAYMRDWLRKKRGTKPGANPGRPAHTPEVLWSKVDKRGPDECWPWIGSTNYGYGRAQIDGWSYYAHRVIFNLVYPGVITLSAPKKKTDSGFLMHSCDNRLCCNPAHLKVATIKENNNDCQQKGRRNLPKGENHHRAVFSNQETEQILELSRTGHSARRIAEMLNKNRDSVKSLLYRNRIDPQPRLVTTTEEIIKILEMYAAGSTAKHIAETMHKNLSTVKSILQRNRS